VQQIIQDDQANDQARLHILKQPQQAQNNNKCPKQGPKREKITGA
jgi:hypothetical protein